MENTWSKNLISLTKERAGIGTFMKNIDGNSGIIVGFNLGAEGGIVLNGVTSKGYIPVPSGKEIARYCTVDEMIAGGWAID